MIQLGSLILLIVLICGCVQHKTEQPDATSLQTEKKAAHVTSTAEKRSEDFLPVKEMLSQKCAPCHNPGGKMYERLPFDNPEAVKSHGASILQRLNTVEDKQILEQWLLKTQG